jgi:integrase/recombinase XerD
MVERSKLMKVDDSGRKALMDGIGSVSGEVVRPDDGGDAIAVAWPVRAAPLDRLPGSSTDDPFLRLAAAWLIGHPTHTATAYRRDLHAWATWCTQLGTHPLAAERHHVDTWVRHLTTTPQPRTGRPASPATVARRLSALSGFYDFGVHDAEVLTHSPVASVRRPRVSDESAAVGLTTDQLQRLLTTAATHSPRLAALVAVLTFCGLRISEALGADLRDYGHDQGHRVLRVVRKGGKAARIPLPPVVVRTLDTYLGDRTSGPIFLAANNIGRYPYTSAYEQLGRLCHTAALPPGVSPHSLRHSYATEALRLGAALQDVQDALGHADPRTTRRYDRRRHDLDRSPNYLLATALTHPHEQ